MGTSNWQNIPYCVDALMKIEPKRVLDVGVGFGRWGIIVREFCDVWMGRVHREQWSVRVEGIEGFEKNIDEYHQRFYDHIHLGDARTLIDTLPAGWDVVIFGDVLEHFEKDTARRLLNTCLERAAYVLVNIPLGDNWPQDDAYGNVFERHLSSWEAEEFEEFSLVRRSFFQDYIGRPFGTFILSRADPRRLAAGLFSPVPSHVGVPAAPTSDALDAVLRRVTESVNELTYIKQHSSYRAAARLRRSGAWNALRWAKNRNARVVTLSAVGQHAPESNGSEVWLLGASPNAGEPTLPWDFIEADTRWHTKHVPEHPYGRCLVSTGSPADAGANANGHTHAPGVARVPVDADPELRFLSHPWSGKIEVKFRGRREVIDLYSPQSRVVTVRPARSPMLDHAAPLPGTPVAIAPAPAAVTAAAAPSAPADPTLPTDADRAYIRAIREARATVLAVHCPRYLGVTSSTRGLFEHLYALPANADRDPSSLTDEEVEHHAAVIEATGVGHIVLSGGDDAQYRLLRHLKRNNPDLRCDLFWHGSFVQHAEDYTWWMFRRWVDAARAGQLHSIATAKAGMERFFQSLGVKSSLLLNRVPGAPMAPPTLDDSARHVGLWISGTTFRKNPFAMLSALAMVPNVRLHAAGLEPRASEVINFLGIPVELESESPLPHAQLLEAMRRTHLTLYVTFSECCPMLPLESLRVGVPCLTGPTSHLFEEDPFLFDRLVVPFNDRADRIADAVVRAIDERDAIITAYAAWHKLYDARCKESIAEFLKN